MTPEEWESYALALKDEVAKAIGPSIMFGACARDSSLVLELDGADSRLLLRGKTVGVSQQVYSLLPDGSDVTAHAEGVAGAFRDQLGID